MIADHRRWDDAESKRNTDPNKHLPNLPVSPDSISSLARNQTSKSARVRRRARFEEMINGHNGPRWKLHTDFRFLLFTIPRRSIIYTRFRLITARTAISIDPRDPGGRPTSISSHYRTRLLPPDIELVNS